MSILHRLLISVSALLAAHAGAEHHLSLSYASIFSEQGKGHRGGLVYDHWDPNQQTTYAGWMMRLDYGVQVPNEEGIERRGPIVTIASYLRLSRYFVFGVGLSGRRDYQRGRFDLRQVSAQVDTIGVYAVATTYFHWDDIYFAMDWFGMHGSLYSHLSNFNYQPEWRVAQEDLQQIEREFRKGPPTSSGFILTPRIGMRF